VYPGNGDGNAHGGNSGRGRWLAVAAECSWLALPILAGLQLGSASRVCLTECIEELPEGLRLAGSEQLLVGLTNAEKSVSSQTLIRCGVAPVGICRRFAELMDGAQAAVWLRPHGLTRFPCCHSFGRRVSRRRVSALGKRGNRQRVLPRTSGAATKERGKGHVYHSRTRFTGRPR
jgi:hypothetical protein